MLHVTVAEEDAVPFDETDTIVLPDEVRVSVEEEDEANLVEEPELFLAEVEVKDEVVTLAEE